MLSSSEPACKTRISGYVEVYTIPCGKLTATSSNQAPTAEFCWDHGICQNTYFMQQQLESFIMQTNLAFLKSIISS